MAKKLSKTQKQKKNTKKKIKKSNSNLEQTIKINQVHEKTETKPQIKSKKPVINNNKRQQQESSKKEKKFSLFKFNLKQKNKQVKQNKKIAPKKAKKINPKLEKILTLIKNNLHIIFNVMLLSFFIIMIIGFSRIKVLNTKTIIYISAIALILISVAISYNKYLSGKVFTTILTIIMGFVIYKMNYTYDFINNLNSNVYEYKDYYVVTFDNSINKNIYNINNKKVGLLKDNCTNIERKLNTKLTKVNYIEYTDINDLFKDFYTQKFRAILVNENQYKYLLNNIESDQKVKILYEFKANAKK